MSSGISMSGPLATMFEWVNAAHNDNMSFADFQEMGIDYQQTIIAHYRVSQRMDAVKAYDDYRKSKRG